MTTRGTSREVTTVFHVLACGKLNEIQSNLRRNKLHRTNQGPNFLGGSFSNRDNMRGPIQFRRESQPQHLKKWFFLKNRPIYFKTYLLQNLRLWRRPACQNLPKPLDISSATARVALGLLKTLAILSDTTVTRFTVDRKDLKPH